MGTYSNTICAFASLLSDGNEPSDSYACVRSKPRERDIASAVFIIASVIILMFSLILSPTAAFAVNRTQNTSSSTQSEESYAKNLMGQTYDSEWNTNELIEGINGYKQPYEEPSDFFSKFRTVFLKIYTTVLGLIIVLWIVKVAARAVWGVAFSGGAAPPNMLASSVERRGNTELTGGSAFIALSRDFVAYIGIATAIFAIFGLISGLLMLVFGAIPNTFTVNRF